MNLISMTDFVLEQISINQFDEDFTSKVVNYANFLKQPLKLGMFIPCDENDLPLDKPKGWLNQECDTTDCCHICKCEKYQQAKERVLFEGFELIEISKNLRIVKNQIKDCQVFANQVGNIYYKCVGFEIIDNLVKYNLKLTDSAIKQLNL